MYYFYYKIKNNINNKTYYGVHSTKNIRDGYLGSGVAIRKSVEKYGRNNFSKTILKYFDTEEEMYEYEKVAINENVVSDSNTYNITLGGRGGFSHIDNVGEKNPMVREDIRKKVSESERKTKQSNIEYYRNIAIENLKKATEYNRGRKRPEHSSLMKQKAKDSNIKYLCVSPEGYSYLISSLKDFAQERGFVYSTIYGALKRGKCVNRGESCGWYFQRV